MSKEATTDRLDHNNGLKTKIIKDEHGVIQVQAICITRNNNKKTVTLPVESLVAWYPLYFNYDYNYVPSQNDLVLTIDKDAPVAIKQQFGLKKGKVYTKYRLKDFVNYENGKANVDNPIFHANMALLHSLESLDLVTFLTPNYLKKDLNDNYLKINNIIQSIKDTCKLKMQEEQAAKMAKETGKIKFPTLNLDTEQQERNVFKYLSDSDAQLLVELGGAYRMTELMDRVLKARLSK